MSHNCIFISHYYNFISLKSDFISYNCSFMSSWLQLAVFMYLFKTKFLTNSFFNEFIGTILHHGKFPSYIMETAKNLTAYLNGSNCAVLKISNFCFGFLLQCTHSILKCFVFCIMYTATWLNHLKAYFALIRRMIQIIVIGLPLIAHLGMKHFKEWYC